MSKYILVIFLAFFMLGGCGGGGKSAPATLTSITVISANTSIAPNTTANFVATGVYSDGTAQNLTNSVTWSSSNTSVATVSNTQGTRGVVSAKATGTTTISAAFGSISGSLVLTSADVTSIAVTPVNPKSIVGTTRQFTATGTLTNNATQNLTKFVTNWLSSNTGIATISTGGLATALAVGSSSISATFSGITGITGTTTLAVEIPASITVTPANPTITVGSTQQFTATATLSDATTQVISSLITTWSSSAPAIATINSSGLASALTAGSTSITATYQGVTGTTSLTVKALASIAITPLNPTVGIGSTLQLVATGRFSDSTTQNITESATWASDNTAIASVSDLAGSKGVVTGNAAGSCNITATSGGITTSVFLMVTQPAFAYVTNSGDNTLSAVDTATNAVVQSIAVGNSPQGVAVNTSTSRVYVANSLGNTVSVVNSDSNMLVGTLTVGLLSPYGVAVNASTNRLYVTNIASNNVTVFNTSDNSFVITVPVGSSPQGIVVDASANRVYVTNSVSNTVSVINATNNTVIATILVGLTPKGGALDVSASRLYVANSVSGTITVIDTLTNTVVDTIVVGTLPTGVAVDVAAGRVYVSNTNSKTVSVIDSASNTIIASINVGAGPQGIAVRSGTGRAYVINTDSNTMSVIDTSINAVLTTVTVGSSPKDIALSQ